MFEILKSYLFQHKSISIPGLGTIIMEVVPASLDTGTKEMLPPIYQFRFDKYFDAPDRQFFSWLATHKDIADFEAIRMYNEFSFDLREKINAEQKVSWSGIGDLKRDEEGNIVFESAIQNPEFVRPVPARKVIHPDARHRILVGDNERTSDEMNEWLQGQDSDRKRPWWLYAAIAAAISVLVLVFHFYNNGWNIGSTGNQQKLEVEK